MAEATDVLEIFKQNLIDAGCKSNEITKCLSYAEAGMWDKLNSMLNEHKKYLLNQVHIYRKQIDCLDYMQYQISKHHYEGKFK